MKKTLLTSVFAALMATVACASDGGLYSDTETYKTSVRYNTDTVNYVAPARQTVVASAPCATPVRVKTHTEVIDHYQVYRPVTVYEPAGTYSERRIVRNAPCGRCNG